MASRGVRAPGIRSPQAPTFLRPQTGNTPPRTDTGTRTFLTYRADPGGSFAAQLAQYRVSAATLHKNLAQINEQAVRELSREASKELRRRIRGRGRQQSRNEHLVELASNHRANSTWNKDGFHFFDPKAIRFSKAFPYYRAIELGSRHAVGRYIPLTFFRGGTQVLPPSVRYQQVKNARRKQAFEGRVTSRGRVAARGGYTAKHEEGARQKTLAENIDQLRDYATYSGRNGTPYKVRIRNPIRPYYYITTAVGNFRSQNRYEAIMLARVNKLAPILARNLARRG